MYKRQSHYCRFQQYGATLLASQKEKGKDYTETAHPVYQIIFIDDIDKDNLKLIDTYRSCLLYTSYNKQEDISKKYSSKFISTDYSKHSRSTHVYKQQEMYDYKSSDNEIKQRLEEARKKILNYRAKSVKSKVSLEKRNLLKLVIGGFVILSVAFSFFTTERLDIEMVELDRIEVNGNNNDLMMAGNFQHGGLVYQNSDDIYLGINYQLNKTDSSFSDFYNMTPESDGNVYVEGNYIYYSSFESYRRYDINAEEEIGLFNVEKVLPIKNHRFLYTDGTGLYLYENEESKQLADYNTSVFTFEMCIRDRLKSLINYLY